MIKLFLCLGWLEAFKVPGTVALPCGLSDCQPGSSPHTSALVMDLELYLRSFELVANKGVLNNISQVFMA